MLRLQIIFFIILIWNFRCLKLLIIIFCAVRFVSFLPLILYIWALAASLLLVPHQSCSFLDVTSYPVLSSASDSVNAVGLDFILTTRMFFWANELSCVTCWRTYWWTCPEYQWYYLVVIRAWGFRISVLLCRLFEELRVINRMLFFNWFVALIFKFWRRVFLLHHAHAVVP